MKKLKLKLRKMSIGIISALLIPCSTVFASSVPTCTSGLCTIKNSAVITTQEVRSTILPEGFVYITDIIQNVILEPRYFSTYNFIGKRIDGYNSPNIIMTNEAANALKIVSSNLENQGYILYFFDAYRQQ